MRNYFRCFLFILYVSSITSCNSRRNEDFEVRSGKVVGIIDGDTYDILVTGNEIIRIRMEGIDAPEKGMPFYRKAKMYLSGLCDGKVVRLEVNTIDKYGRRIAYSYLEDGNELSHAMIKAGLAWHYKNIIVTKILLRWKYKLENLKPVFG